MRVSLTMRGRARPVFKRAFRTAPRLCLMGGCALMSVLICTNGWPADNASSPPVSTNQQDPATSPTAKSRPRSPYLELKEMERNATPEDLRTALTNSAVFMRTRAIKVIKFRGDKTFIADLSKALEDERAQVRVEAAKALVAFDQPKGKTALVGEMARARQAQVKLSSGKARRTFWDTEDLTAWLDGAGALADLGNKSGYDILKTTILTNDLLLCKSLAAIGVAKFVRFEDQRSDAQRVLFMAADDAVDRIDKRLAENPDRRPAAEIGYFDVVSRMLAQIGGEQEVAKLKLYAQDKDPDVRRYAVAYLHAIERRENAHEPPSDQKVTDPEKGQSP